MYLSKSDKSLAIILIFVIIILIFGSLWLIKSRSVTTTPSRKPLNLQQEIRESRLNKAKVIPLPTPCREYRLTQTSIGLDKIVLVDKKKSLEDYFYTGTVRNITTTTSTKQKTTCTDLVINLQSSGGTITQILLPENLAARTQYGPVYPEIYRKHFNARVSIRLRYNTGQAARGTYTLTEWQPYIFYAN